MATDESTESVESMVSVSKHLSEKMPELKQLEDVLTCLICYAPLLHPNTTPCNHLFCSLCIRKSLQYRQSCPSCNVELHESDLSPDKTSEKLLPIFQALVKRLETVSLNSSSGESASKDREGKENRSPNSLTNVGIQSLVPEKRQPCPHCKVSVARNFFDCHVSKCKESAKIKPAVQIPRKKPAPLPNLIYSLMKEKDLRKKCREFGLESKGDKKDLIQRLQKFKYIFNAEVLLDNPRSGMQIAMQVAKEEKEEKSNKFSRPEILQFDRNTDKEVIEVKQKTYLKENKSDFSSLVQQVKARKVPENVEKDAEESKSSTLIDTVDNLEDICGKEDNDNEDFLANHPRDPEIDFELPGKSEFDPGPGPSNVPRASSSSLKRKSSPIDDSKIKQPPLKLVKTLKSSAMTPQKPEEKSVVGSPSQNIFAKLTQSAEQRKKIPQQQCPVCSVQVSVKFINIHLDKCLESGKTESRSASKPRLSSQGGGGVASLIKKQRPVKKRNDSQEDDEEEEEELDLSQDDIKEIKPSIPERSKLPRSAVKAPIIESSQVEPERDKTPCKEDEEDARAASPPVTPPLYRYTETISQSQECPPPSNHDSEKDMFAASDNEECGSTVSDNLLDLDDEIEDMMKAALQEENAEKLENRKSKNKDANVNETKAVTKTTRRKTKNDDEKKESKHASVSVLPKPRKTRSRANTPEVSSSVESLVPLPVVKRTSGRRTNKSKS